MARPAEFDRTDVLEKAMGVFWRTGYSATSVTDLVNATSLKPGSLYGAFKSKRELFIEVIDTYAARSLSRVSTVVGEADSPIKGIETFFDCFCKDLVADNIGKGCLMVNTMLELATEDDHIRERISGYLDGLESHFREALIKAQEKGEVDKNLVPEDMATYLMTNIWGLRVLSTKRPEPQKYEAIVTNIMNALHAPKH